MSQKTVFDALNEKLDQVVLGRRYIIAEIGKLKEVVSGLTDSVSGSSMDAVSGAVQEMKSFMQQAINSLSDLKNSVSRLGNTINSLNTGIETVLQAVSSGGGISTAPAPAPAPPAAKASKTTPAAKKTKADKAAEAAPASTAGEADSFDKILTAAESKSTAVEIGEMIDALRTDLSKENPLNPILFELSMEAGRLKALGSNPLNDSNHNTLKSKIEKWKTQG
jgi:hypothetical protein